MASGSWYLSARNIHYENDYTLTCELQDFNGNWIKNKLTFVPSLEYSNINGKFYCDGYTNGVEINNRSNEAITTRYKQVSIDEYLSDFNNNYLFTIDKEIIKTTTKKKCITITLFKNNSEKLCDNHYIDEDVNFKQLIYNFDNFCFDDFCVNMYLANDLQHLMTHFLNYEFLNIFIMKSSSIDIYPKMLWNFINMTNKNYDVVYICDINESWEWVKQLENCINLNNYILKQKQCDISL